MGQFKPMVKMFTDEPSVILKLKKGGKVKAAGQSEGFKSMASNTTKTFEGAEDGVAPKKPSMAKRQKAMNPNQYAKGGNVAKKQMGGVMPAAGGATALGGTPPMGSGAMTPMGRAALSRMSPAARAARAAQVRRAMTGMKKGGSADCSALEKELKHHESMSAEKAHGKASGGAIDKAETKTTVKGNAGKFANTKMHDGDKTDKAHGTKGVKEGNAGGYAKGGNVKPFVNTKMHDGDKTDRAHGTGGVKMSNAGGFKKGGKVPGLTGATIEGGNWENRPANSAKPGVTNTKTGEVKESNGGGYKKGGSAKKAYATGGNVVSDGKAVKMPRHFVSRPVANSLQSGTFKKGGKVGKYAEGDSVEDMSKGAYDRAVNEKPMGSGFASKVQGAIDKFFGAKPANSVTKTKESVTVTPANRKRGGSAKC